MEQKSEASDECEECHDDGGWEEKSADEAMPALGQKKKRIRKPKSRRVPTLPMSCSACYLCDTLPNNLHALEMIP